MNLHENSFLIQMKNTKIKQKKKINQLNESIIERDRNKFRRGKERTEKQIHTQFR